MSARDREVSAPSQSLTHVSTGAIASTPSAAGTEASTATTANRVRVSSPGRDAWRRFRKNWAAMLSLAVILALIILATFAPMMHTSDPNLFNYNLLDAAPSGHHWFGTDGDGADLYSRILYGTRIPLIVGLIGTQISTILGLGIGVVSGYFGGVVDSLLSRLTDFMFAFPAFILAFIVVAFYGKAFDSLLGASGKVVLLTILFAGLSWPGLMRFVRSLALSMREAQFVEAARTSGSSNWKIIRRHLLPNMYGLILVQAALITVAIVYTEATLSIFGLGPEPTNADLGLLLSNGSQVLNVNFSETLFPAIFLTVMLLAFTFIGDGVRDAVDPRMNA